MNVRSLSRDELLALLSAARAKRERDWLMILVAFRHGLRATEVVSLTRDNFADGYLDVQRLKGSNLFRLREWAYGKASQPLEHSGGEKPVDISHDAGTDLAKRLRELLERAARRGAAKKTDAGGADVTDLPHRE